MTPQYDEVPPRSRTAPDRFFRHLFGAAVASTLAAAVGQGMSLVVPVIVARRFGVTQATDAFFFAFACVSLLLTGLVGVAQTSAVPYLVEALKANPRDPRLVAQMSAGLAAASLGAMALSLAAGGPVLRLWAPGIDVAAVIASLVALTPFLLIASFAASWSGVLAADRDFLSPAWSLVCRWVGGAISLLLLGRQLGIVSLAYGYAAGEAVRAAIVGVRAARRFPSFRLLSHPHRGLLTGGFATSALAQFAGSLVLAATTIVDRIAASRLSPGSVTLLDFAERLWQVPVGLVMSGFLVVMLTEWSERGSRTTSTDLRRETAVAALFVGLVASLGAVVFWPLRDGIAGMIFGQHQLGPAELGSLGDLLGLYFLVTPFYVAGLTYSRALLAQKRGEWLFAVALMQLGSKIMLNDFAVAHWGLPGLVVTTGVMYVGALVIFACILHRSERVHVQS